MKIPAWAPKELLAHRDAKIAQLQDQKRRRDESSVEDDEIMSLEEFATGAKGGRYFPTLADKLEIIDALVFDSGMERVWKALDRRKANFKEAVRYEGRLFGGSGQVLGLVGACIVARMHWLESPKMTRAQYRDYYESVAAKALELSGLLLSATHDRLILDTTKYVGEDYFKELLTSLDPDDRWRGDTFFLEHLIRDGLPSIPGLLLKLHHRAKDLSQAPISIPQPNSADAEVHHFIREISDYFSQAYGQPLHETVALIAAAIFKRPDIDQDKVRALIRADKQSRKDYTRKKIAEMKEGFDGE